MPDAVVAMVIALHVGAVLAGAVAAHFRGRMISGPYLCFSLAIPVFGAAVCWVFALSPEPKEGIRDHMMRNAQHHETMVGISNEADKIVPLEEAFIINAPKQRRELMMNLLRSDPRQYLDLLLLARFNEDPETSHYATATLTEVQRQIQLELQQMQIKLHRNPRDTQTRLACIELLNTYVDSGLLEGQMLERYRRALRQVLYDLPQKRCTVEICSIRVRNDLALHMAQEARTQALAMIERWPEDERSYLEMLEVCVQTRDQHALEALMAQIDQAPVEWTRAGLERIHYFGGRQE